jgi:hypothetical protein
MQVELGNSSPHAVIDGDVQPLHDGAAAVTYYSVPDTYTYVPAPKAADLANEVMRQVVGGQEGITQMPDQEAVLAVVQSWRFHSATSPAWVWSDNDDFAKLLGAYFDCPVGRPDDVEDRYHTNAGPPGVHPPVAAEAVEEEK